MSIHLGRFFKILTSGSLHLHSSQYGEDVYLHKRYRNRPVTGFYIDVGAHHPFKLSNTAYLWALGWSGVNVDANPKTIDLYNKHRPKDTNICGAVVSSARQLVHPFIDFYFEKDIDNCATCDPVLALERNFTKKLAIPTLSMVQVINKARENHAGNFEFLNVDIEGLDEEVIEDIANWPEKPQLIFIEIYSEQIPDLIQKPSTQNLLKHGYLLIGKCGHTCIFAMK